MAPYWSVNGSVQLNPMRRSLRRLVAITVASIMRPGVVYDPINFRLWQRRGYHITPVHFYSPIPDTRDLDDRADVMPSHTPGLDLRFGQQLNLLNQLGPLAEATAEWPTYSERGALLARDNDAFGGLDTQVYFALLRHFRPHRVLEVGAGFSTLVALSALSSVPDSRLVSVDPWPRDFLLADGTAVEAARQAGQWQLICQPVQDLPAAHFLELDRGDVLFVDSSHIARRGSDVVYLVTQVLPRLNPGVIVHFHDIHIPYDYPVSLARDKLQFWNEQYLLSAYLADNPRVEVLVAVHALAMHHHAILRSVFPHAVRWEGCSFWFQLN